MTRLRTFYTMPMVRVFVDVGDPSSIVEGIADSDWQFLEPCGCSCRDLKVDVDRVECLSCGKTSVTKQDMVILTAATWNLENGLGDRLQRCCGKRITLRGNEDRTLDAQCPQCGRHIKASSGPTLLKTGWELSVKARPSPRHRLPEILCADCDQPMGFKDDAWHCKPCGRVVAGGEPKKVLMPQDSGSTKEVTVSFTNGGQLAVGKLTNGGATDFARDALFDWLMINKANTVLGTKEWPLLIITKHSDGKVSTVGVRFKVHWEPKITLSADKVELL